ncbi:MAG: glycosyltransferase family 87 protein [Acidobacteriota bacterium]
MIRTRSNSERFAENLGLRQGLLKWGLFLALAITLALTGGPLLAALHLPVADFSAYWAAARLQLEKADPYSPEQLLERQQAIGGSEFHPFLNPPWSLALLIPFGLFEYPVSRLLFLIMSLLALAICANRLWRHYGGTTSERWVAQLLTFAFFPVLWTLNLGQMTPFVLLGVVGFLICVRAEKWLGAGAWLFLASLKPHVLYLIWPAVGLWALRQKRAGVFLGGAIAMGAASLVVLATHPSVLQDFLVFSKSLDQALFRHSNPALGTLLRVLFGLEKHSLQYLPMLGGGLWFVFHWIRNRRDWNWDRQLPLLILVSLCTSGYVWIHDDPLLLVPGVSLAAGICLGGRTRLIVAFFAVWLTTNGLTLVLNLARFGDLWFVWLAPAWLGIFLALPAGKLSKNKGKPAA